jgi:hypothetical protein
VIRAAVAGIRRRGPWIAGLFVTFGTTACGGGVPLLHPAHVLPPGRVEVGAGMSGELALQTSAAGSSTLQELAVSPGVAPWASGRVGIAGDNEGGLTYTGRTVRLDGRHAFPIGGLALSIGLGGSAIVAHQPGHGFDASGVYGGGLDVPVLLGIHTTGDLYSLWIGPRGGVELLRGRLAIANVGEPNEDLVDAEATHGFIGGLVGFRVGFRHVHVSVEGSFAYHHASGKIGSTPVTLDQTSVTPGGALQIAF